MFDLNFQPIEMNSSHFADDQISQVCNGMIELYRKIGFKPPWIGYLAVNSNGQYLGTCAFKSPPENGRVEIAYFTFPEFEGNGIATKMAQYLISLAKASDKNILVFAQTLPKENASNYILKKIGFQFAGEVQHPEDGIVWEWQLSNA